MVRIRTLVRSRSSLHEAPQTHQGWKPSFAPVYCPSFLLFFFFFHFFAFFFVSPRDS